MPQTRAEHLQWCKDRAAQYTQIGDHQNAMKSFLSDLNKHPETESHPVIQLSMMLMISGRLNSTKEVAEFIIGTY